MHGWLLSNWTILFSPLFIQMTVSLDAGIQMRCGKFTVFRTNYSWRWYRFLQVQFRSSILKKYFMTVSFFLFTLYWRLTPPLNMLKIEWHFSTSHVYDHDIRNDHKLCHFGNLLNNSIIGMIKVNFLFLVWKGLGSMLR